MLALTKNASEVLHLVLEYSGAAGVRISPVNPGLPGAYQIFVAGGPEPEDTVLTIDGNHVYLDQAALLELSDQILDAYVDPDGSASFGVAPQE